MSTLTKTLQMFAEVSITADKAGIDEKFWSTLAHSGLTFVIIAGIPAHFSVLKECHPVASSQVVDKTADLKEWIYSLDKRTNSLLNIRPNWEIFGFSEDLLTDRKWTRHNIECEVFRSFQRELFARISEMGVSVWELASLPNSTLIEKNKEIIFRQNRHLTVDNLIRDIKIIIAQREFFAKMIEYSK